MQAGEELTLKLSASGEIKKPWAELGLKEVILGGINADDMTDDDNDSIPDTGVATIPLQAGVPLLSIKGFYIS